MGRAYSDDDFQTLCFAFGIELDDAVEEMGECGTETVWRIEVAANRYDLLCVEGIGSALATFLGMQDTPVM